MLARIEQLRGNLRKSERMVADVVLAEPNAVIGETIAVLARRVGVSEPTVLRFCRALGYKGFQDFKLKLAQDLATGVRYFHRGVTPGQPASELARTVFDGYIHILLKARNSVDAIAVEQAIDMLEVARRIEFYAVGRSGVVAVDAQHRFIRLGVPCAAYTDPHLQGASASMMEEGGVVVAVSQSGRSADLLDNVRLASERGARIIGLTASGSPLAATSTVTLRVDLEQDEDVYVPMRLRMAHMVYVDLLAAGVAARRSPGSVPSPGQNLSRRRRRRM